MNTFLRTAVIAATATFSFSACQPETDDTEPVTTPLVAETKLNVSYGSDTAQRMDIYLPAGRTTTSTKTVFVIHGGAWAGGDKSEVTPLIPVLQGLLPGWTVVNLNYRLASIGLNRFPTQENDVKAAVQLVYDKRAEYKISDGFVTMGYSAGAHLALLHAYKHTTPVKIQAAVSFFGPTNMSTFYNELTIPTWKMGLQELLQGTPASNPTGYAQSSPSNFVSASSTPTIFIHGGADPIVPASQSQTLHNALKALGVPTAYEFYPTEGHGFSPAVTLASLTKAADFIKLHAR